MSAIALFLSSAMPVHATEVSLTLAPGGFSVSAGTAGARLQSRVAVERRDGDRWVAMPPLNLFLIAACQAADPPPCLDLAPGAVLTPPPWTGRFCAAQCPASCDAEGRASPGTYRIVVKSCSGAASATSRPFAWR